MLSLQVPLSGTVLCNVLVLLRQYLSLWLKSTAFTWHRHTWETRSRFSPFVTLCILAAVSQLALNNFKDDSKVIGDCFETGSFNEPRLVNKLYICVQLNFLQQINV